MPPKAPKDEEAPASPKLEEILRGVEKYDEEHIESYIQLSEKRISSLELFALIAALVAGAAVAELSTYDPTLWVSQTRSTCYIVCMAFSVSVSTYCSVVVVMILSAASRLQFTDRRLKKHTVEELYQEYAASGTLLNHVKETQKGWHVILELPDRKVINYPVSLRWISEKYDELRPYIKLFPISTAAFILGLLLRVIDKLQTVQIKILLAVGVVPMLWLTFSHSRKANDITFFQIGMKFYTKKADEQTSLLAHSELSKDVDADVLAA